MGFLKFSFFTMNEYGCALHMLEKNIFLDQLFKNILIVVNCFYILQNGIYIDCQIT